MKTIKLKSLELTNFKGVRECKVAFDSDMVVVQGGNATGKTTLYDAYLWLLFGKDSAGRGDSNGGFNVKTLGEDGRPIYRLEHSVTGVFTVDGVEKKLQRSLVEKWNKKNGSTEEVMNDETQFFINDVRCGTKKEYMAEISEIIPEDLFRMVTNPNYFTSLPAEKQKEMLEIMAGSLSDEDVAQGNAEFMALLDELNGTSLIKFAKEIAAKKKGCNDELKTIPSAIEAVQKVMPENEDWGALERELTQKRETLKGIDAQIADKNAANNATNQRKAQIGRELAQKRMDLDNRKAEIRRNANADYNRATAELDTLTAQLQKLERDCQSRRVELSETQSTIEKLNGEINALRDQYKAVHGEKYNAPEDGSLVCPTCGEPLKGDNLTAQLERMRGNFEQDKAKRLKEIQAAGVPKRKALDAANESITRLQGQIAMYEDRILEAKGKVEYGKAHIPTTQDAEAVIAADAQCVAILNDITELSNRYDADVTPTDVSELQDAKVVLNDGIDALNRLLGNKATLERCRKEIADLEEKRIANNQAIADLERWENTYTAFLKAKDERLMERINGMFKFVSFSFVKEQKNGGEKVTCICTVNGTPYPDVNNAGKINAGLDIINALCERMDVSAPVFIDNAEAVNELLPISSQVVALKVTNDKVLTIK